MRGKAHPTSRNRKTTVTVDGALLERLNGLVGRFGRTQADVIRAGLECLEQRLQPVPAEVR